MIVVHIVEAFGGGVYTYLKSLSNYFLQHDDVKNVIIYSSNRKEIDYDRLALDFNKIEIINIDMQRSISPFKDFYSIFKLRKVLKGLDPDIVHLHSSKAGVLGRLACLGVISTQKVFYSPHGYSFLSLEFSNLKKKLFYNIEKYSQKLLGGTTIACGDTEYEIAQKIGPTTLVRNGIIPENFKKYKKDFSNEKLTIGTLGRVSAQKNPHLFNEIALRFPNFNFIWIGDGELNHMLTAPNISITGWSLDSDITFTHLNNIDIYIQTSLWEGLPIAILEAMALYKPVIATNIIGNKDIVDHNKTGYLFDELNELDDKLPKLIDADFRALLGNNGYKRCNLLFNSDSNFNVLKMIYLDAIANSKL